MLISLNGQKSEKSLGTEDLIKKKLHYFNDYISFKTSLYNKYRIVHFSVIVNFFLPSLHCSLLELELYGAAKPTGKPWVNLLANIKILIPVNDFGYSIIL